MKPGVLPIHLTYALNVHPGESWDEQLTAIQAYSRRIKQNIAPEQPFGLGLRLSNDAALSLAAPKQLNDFRNLLTDYNMYVFSINGFPFGQFHNTAVKEQVYKPDWQSEERRNYTCLLADILAHLLPEGMDGCISTLPITYKPWQDECTTALVCDLLAQTVMHLHHLSETTGRCIHLGLEPEPDCLLETTGEVIDFFKNTLFLLGRDKLCALLACASAEAENILRRHLGVCFDTCHLAVEFEDITHSIKRLHAEGILLSKLQVSSALRTNDPERLRPFVDPIYLHQTKRRNEDGSIVSFPDLTPALDSPAAPGSETRTHYHVPLYLAQRGPLSSTADLLTPAFFQAVCETGCHFVEIETYTFDILPDDMKHLGLVDSICQEYQWVIERLSL